LKSHKKFDTNKSNAEKMATFKEIYGKALLDDAKFEKLFNRWLLNKNNGKQNEKIYFDSTKINSKAYFLVPSPFFRTSSTLRFSASSRHS